MSSPDAEAIPAAYQMPELRLVIPVLGVTQILAWGSSYYLLAVLAKPIASDTGWPPGWVVGGLSLGLLTAGLVSPRVGDSIQRHGGRPVLAVSAVLLSLGLAGVALAPVLPIYLGSWLVLGAGMGAGLYDAAFATLGWLYGQRARTPIATLTLFGGFASTACWPLSAMLVSEFGWRGTCLIYAGIHLVVLLPLYLFALPRDPKRRVATPAEHPGDALPHSRATGPAPAGSTMLFVLLAAAIMVGSMISTAVSVHLLTILQDRGVALAAAVALGAVVGPSQVGARAIEMLISRYHHPIWTMVASTVLVATGIGALWAGLPLVSAALVFYGGGIGIKFDRARHAPARVVRRVPLRSDHGEDRHAKPCRTGGLTAARGPPDGTSWSKRHPGGALRGRHLRRLAGGRPVGVPATTDFVGGAGERTAFRPLPSLAGQINGTADISAGCPRRKGTG